MLGPSTDIPALLERRHFNLVATRSPACGPASARPGSAGRAAGRANAGHGPPGSSPWMDPVEPEPEVAMLNRYAGRAGSGRWAVTGTGTLSRRD